VAVILAGLLICILAVGLPTMTASEIGHGYQNDPVAGVAAGIARGLPLSSPLVTILPLYVGFLGFVMLLMSTNTGVIGASRVTYSMARYNTFPTWFSHIHPKYRVPTRTVVVFTLASVAFVVFVWFMGTYGAQLHLPKEDPTIILGDLYNYGALISFMLVNLALISLRNKRPDLYRPFRSPLTVRIPRKPGTYELPLLPLLGFFVCLGVWILVLSLHEIGKYVGTLWFIAGIAIYLWYRNRRKLHWRDSVEGTLETHPDVAHNLHPEIAHLLVRKKNEEKADEKAEADSLMPGGEKI
jgi:APA family basic amino acid/polyamine antiporter